MPHDSPWCNESIYVITFIVAFNHIKHLKFLNILISLGFEPSSCTINGFQDGNLLRWVVGDTIGNDTLTSNWKNEFQPKLHLVSAS